MSAREDAVDVDAIRRRAQAASLILDRLDRVDGSVAISALDVPALLDALAASEAARQEADAALREIDQTVQRAASTPGSESAALVEIRTRARGFLDSKSTPSHLEGERE